MANNHEVISFNDKLPIKLFINRIGSIDPHWHQSIELSVILNGEVDIKINESNYHLKQYDVILVNSNTVHSLVSQEAVLATLQVRLDLMNITNKNLTKQQFDLNSTHLQNENNINIIRSILAQMIKQNLYDDESNELINSSLVYRLLFEITDKFRTDEKIDNYKSLDRLTSILAYINSEYKEQISLDSLANQEFLSTAYLSRFFKENMGLTFTSYLKGVRLAKAMELLPNNEMSLEQIALEVGFPNSRAFVEAFKEKYNTLPSNYRKGQNLQSGEKSMSFNKDRSVNYLVEDFNNYNEIVTEFIDHYAKTDKIQKTRRKIDIQTMNDIVISSNNEAPLIHTWKNFIGMSRARDILNHNVQEQIKTLQNEIGFKNIKIHSIFDDDMMTYSEINQKPLYNFMLIDEVYDFLLSVGLNPLVQFSFMPSAIASKPNKTIFRGSTNTSEPKDLNKWNDLVEAFTKHIISRYGLELVKKWKFTVWNEPSTSNSLFGLKDDESFYTLYTETYNTVKNICSSLQFGGPTAFSTYGKGEEWLYKFLDFAKSNNVMPDFITIHYYDIDLSWIEKLDNSGNWGKSRIFLSPVENSFELFIERLNSNLKTKNINLPIYLTEWNNTVSHKDLLSDTCFKSAYIVKNIIDSYDKLDSFGYWLISDFHQEHLIPPYLFHGGLGLFTYNGIKKPSYYAFYLLGQLKDILIEKGNGYIITRDYDNNYSIILYNYIHYSYDYSRENNIGITLKHRYSAFSSMNKKVFSIHIPIKSGQYLCESIFINQSKGDSFEKYRELTDCDSSIPISKDYLNSLSVPGCEYEKVNIQRDYHLVKQLEPFEIRLIKLNKII